MIDERCCVMKSNHHGIEPGMGEYERRESGGVWCEKGHQSDFKMRGSDLDSASGDLADRITFLYR